MSQKEMPPGDFSLFLLGHSYGQSAFFFSLALILGGEQIMQYMDGVL